MNKFPTVMKKLGVLTILFISLIMISTPVKSAFGDVYNCYSRIEFDYDENAANDPILPLDMVKNIPVTLNYSVAGEYAKEILPYYVESDGTPLKSYLYLYIDDTPDWCTATISPPLLLVPPSVNGETSNVTLSIKINETAHAFSKGRVKIKVDVVGFGAVKGGTFYGNISFMVGYLPLLDIDVLESPTRVIEPDSTAVYNIKIDNLGNAKTRLKCDILNPPKGWIISFPSNTVLGTKTMGENPTGTITITVKPPYEFGYHNDREVIQISVTPMYNESIVGQDYTLSFIIKSKGFSTPGFEVILLFFVIIFITAFSKKQQKIRSKIESSYHRYYEGGDV